MLGHVVSRDNYYLLVISLTLHTSSSWELMSRHLWRVLPSSSSSKMYFPPSSEALWPSLGWVRRDGWEGEALEGRHSEGGHRGGERVRGGITVLWMDTSCSDWVAGALVTRGELVTRPVTWVSSGLTLVLMMGWMETVSGVMTGKTELELVSIIVTSWWWWSLSSASWCSWVFSPWKTVWFTFVFTDYHKRMKMHKSSKHVASVDVEFL